MNFFQKRWISVRQTKQQQLKQIQNENPYKRQERVDFSEQQKTLANFRGAIKRQDPNRIQTYLKMLSKELHIIPSTDLISGLEILLDQQKKYAQVEASHTAYQALTQLAYRGHVDNIQLFQNMMLAFLKLKETRHMEQLLEFMILNKIHIDHSVIVMMLKQYSLGGPVESAEKLISYCIDRDLGTRTEYFELLVDAYGQAKRPWEAMVVLKRAEEHGHEINPILLRILYAFARNGEIRGLNNTLKVIKDRKIARNTWIYNMQILCFKRAGRLEWALEKYQELKNVAEKDLELKPDEHTFSMIIDMYSKLGDADSAGEILLEMIQHKKPVLNVYFNSVMDAYRKQGKKEKVLEFYRLMQNIGLFVKEDTYNILISLYGSEDFDHLQVILDTMKRNKTLVSKNGISIIMKTYYLNKKYDLVREWYGKLKERGMFPNEVALQTMMRTSMAQGLNLENCLLYYEMATTLKIVNRMLIQEFLLTHLICGTPLNEALSKFLEEMKKYKQPVQLKTIYIVLDYILSPSSFVKSSLHRVDYMPRDEVVPKRPGLAEFKELCKLVEIPTRLDAEITLAKQHLE